MNATQFTTLLTDSQLVFAVVLDSIDFFLPVAVDVVRTRAPVLTGI